MTTYDIRSERATLHGMFSRELAPILTIDPGDTVRFQTLDAGWHVASSVPGEPPTLFAPRDPEHDQGHALCGPIAIRGAEPGMTLVVRINAIHPGQFGWTAAGGWQSRINERLGIVTGDRQIARWEFEAATETWRNQHGYRVRMHPFMGVMGMPPAEPGWHSTSPPRFCGGNLDCKDLVTGSTLYLPIAVPLGLFSVGDGHGAQGDGEVSGTAIECPMDRVDLTFDLMPDLALKMPRAETPAGWVTMGIHADLHEASMIALEGMLDLLGEQFGLPRHEALVLASVAVDLHITQLVNADVLGVHAVLPHEAILRPTA